MKEEGSCDRGMEVCERERGVRTGGERFERGRERCKSRRGRCQETLMPGYKEARRHWS